MSRTVRPQSTSAANRKADPAVTAAGTGARTQHPARDVSLGNQALTGLFKERIGPPGDALEREADRIAETVARRGELTGGDLTVGAAVGAIQRKCAACEEEEEQETIRRAPRGDAAPAATEDAAPEAAATPQPESGSAPSESGVGLVIGDEQEPTRGQMRKGQFLSALRASVCGSVDEALAGTERNSQGCPWIDHWFDYYEGQDAAHVQRALLRYAPEARGAATARDYITVVATRVKRSATTWAATGEMTDMPDDLPDGIAGGGLLGSFGGMFFKARSGGAGHTDPVSVRERLGGGRPLPAGVRSRMESAFGVTFGGVRVHTDADGTRLADRLNARAFTIGSHVAFGAGEFRPGTLAGDALIAHELAHVVQQGGARAVQRSARDRAGGSAQFEDDADTTAVRAVVSMVGGVRRGLADVAPRALPRLKSGLRLQRCGRHDPVPSKTPEIAPTEEALGRHAVACMIQANVGPHTKDSGIWYAQGYKRSFPDEWTDEYLKGYADPEYWEWIGQWQWRLKKGRSASAGVKAWLRGLTIAECYSTAIVAEVDAIRAAIGDARFDELYGSEDKAVESRLELGQKGSNALAGGRLQSTGAPVDVGTIGHRPAKVGEWHYFYNHPKYLLKHPGGVYQGENAMLREDTAPNGDQLWEGLGQRKVTERQMYANMIAEYNLPRTEWDQRRLEQIRQAHGGVLPAEYDPANFPDQLTSYTDILDTDPVTINGVTRKGGYVPTSGKRLDPHKVEELRGAP
jgi:hypothetical protein